MLFWMRSKTYMSKINLQSGILTVENRRSREKKRICSEVSVNSPGNPWSQSKRRNGRLWWEGFAEKESFKPGVKEWRGDGWWEWWVHASFVRMRMHFWQETQLLQRDRKTNTDTRRDSIILRDKNSRDKNALYATTFWDLATCRCGLMALYLFIQVIVY